MTEPDERPDSLAEQAASWVPPWQRPPVSGPEAEPPPERPAARPADPAGEPSADAPAEPAAAEPAAVPPGGEPESGGEPMASGPDAVAPGTEPDADTGAGTDADTRAGTETDADADTGAGAGTDADSGGPAPIIGPQPATTIRRASPPVPPSQARPDTDPAPADGPPAERMPARTPRLPATDLPDLTDDAALRAALESILLVVDEPVAEMVLAQVLEQPTERVARMLDALSADYTAAGHGFDLRRAAGGWRLYTRPEYAAYVERFVLDGQSVRLTQAALETLAVVAYKQPVTRSRISAIRGVNCDGVMRTLVTRGLVEECGTEPETGAYRYRTTTLFLEKLGLNSVDELPALAPFLPDNVDDVEEM